MGRWGRPAPSCQAGSQSSLTPQKPRYVGALGNADALRSPSSPKLLSTILHGGYYTGEAPRNDYITSPEVHPAFGALLARLAHKVWARLLGTAFPFRCNRTWDRAVVSLALDFISYTQGSYARIL